MKLMSLNNRHAMRRCLVPCFDAAGTSRPWFPGYASSTHATTKGWMGATHVKYASQRRSPTS